MQQQQRPSQEELMAAQEKQMMQEMMQEMGAYPPGYIPQNAIDAAAYQGHAQMQQQQQQLADQFRDPVSNRRSLNEIPARAPIVQQQGFEKKTGPQLLREIPRENDPRKVLTHEWRPGRLKRNADEYTGRWKEIMMKLEGRRLRAPGRDWERIGDLGGVRNPYDLAVQTRLDESSAVTVVAGQQPPKANPQRLREVAVRTIDLGGFKIEQF